MIHPTNALVQEREAARPLFDPVEEAQQAVCPSYLAYLICFPVSTHLMAEALIWRDIRTLTDKSTVLDRLAVEVLIVWTTSLATLELIARVALTIIFAPCVFFNKTEDVFHWLLASSLVSLITIPYGMDLLVSNCFSKFATESKRAQAIVLSPFSFGANQRAEAIILSPLNFGAQETISYDAMTYPSRVDTLLLLRKIQFMMRGQGFGVQEMQGTRERVRERARELARERADEIASKRARANLEKFNTLPRHVSPAAPS